MADIIDFPGDTLNDIDPNQILEQAKDKLDDVALIGWTKEGELYIASSTSDIPEFLHLLEKSKHEILSSY